MSGHDRVLIGTAQGIALRSEFQAEAAASAVYMLLRGARGHIIYAAFLANPSGPSVQ